MEKSTRRTFLLILVLFFSLYFTPFSPENAIRLKILFDGNISASLLTKISLTQDMGSPTDTYYCEGFTKNLHGSYHVKKSNSIFWYVDHTS